MWFKHYNDELALSKQHALDAYDELHVGGGNDEERKAIEVKYDTAMKPENITTTVSRTSRNIFEDMGTHWRQACNAFRAVLNNVQNEIIDKSGSGHHATRKSNNHNRGNGSSRNRRGGLQAKGKIHKNENESSGSTDPELAAAPAMASMSTSKVVMSERICHRHLRQQGKNKFTCYKCKTRVDKVKTTGDKEKDHLALSKACPAAPFHKAGAHSYQNNPSKVPRDIMNEFQDGCCQNCGTCIAVLKGKGIWMGHRHSSYHTPIDQCLREDDVTPEREQKRLKLFKNWLEAADSNNINWMTLADVDELVRTHRTQERPVAQNLRIVNNKLIVSPYNPGTDNNPGANRHTGTPTPTLTSGNAEDGYQQMAQRCRDLEIQVVALTQQLKAMEMSKYGASSSNSVPTFSSVPDHYGNVNKRFEVGGQLSMPIFLSGSPGQIVDEAVALETVAEAGVNTQTQHHVYPIAVVREALAKAKYNPNYQSKMNPSQKTYAEQLEDKYMVYSDTAPQRAIQMTEKEILASNTN